MDAWTLSIIGIFLVICILLVAMDRSSKKRFREHEREMDRIYGKYKR